MGASRNTSRGRSGYHERLRPGGERDRERRAARDIEGLANRERQANLDAGNFAVDEQVLGVVAEYRRMSTFVESTHALVGDH